MKGAIKKMIKVLELFGGIGAPRKALEQVLKLLDMKLKSIDYVEILPFAVTAYNNMFDNNYNIQDIKTWNLDVDILVHGSPCQDFSKNGKNNINTGRSILYERTLEIIGNELKNKPQLVVWENVPNLVHRHREHFDHYLQTMKSYGYTSSWKIDSASNHNVPQNRERVYVFSFLGNYSFKFPEPKENTKTIRDVLDYSTRFKDFQLSDNELGIFFVHKNGSLCVREATKLGYKELDEFDVVNVEFPNSETRRGRVGKKFAKTIVTRPRQAIFYDGRLRLLTALEHTRFMGFDDEDYYRMKNAGITDSDITFLMGNSMCPPVLVDYFKAVFEQYDFIERKPIA